jgi:hypothetical protein
MKNNSIPKKRLIASELSTTYIFFISFIMIILASFIHYYNGVYGGDLEGINYDVELVPLIFYTIISILCLVVSRWMAKFIAYNKSSKYVFICKQKPILYLFFISLSLFFAFVAVVGGVGTIQRGVETNRIAELIFALFNPYIFIVLMIYLVYSQCDSGLYSRVALSSMVIIYLYLTIRSGFTGFLIFMLPIFFLLMLKFFSMKASIYIMVLSILLLPFIRIGKWIIGSGFHIEDLNFDLFLNAFRGVVERFSVVPNMIYIEEALNKEIFLGSQYLPFFQGYLGSFFHKLFFNEPVMLNTLMLHQVIQNTDSDSNSTFPIISYFSLDFHLGFYTLLYAVGLILILSLLINFILGGDRLGKSLVSFFVFYVIFFYVSSGWLWALWGVLQSAFIFSFMLIFFGSFKIIKN